MAVLQYLMMGRAAAGRTIITGQRWGALENGQGELGLGNTSETTSMTRLGSELIGKIQNHQVNREIIEVL